MPQIQKFFGNNYYFDYKKWKKQLKINMIKYAEKAIIYMEKNPSSFYKFKYENAIYIIWDGKKFLKRAKKINTKWEKKLSYR